MKRTVWIRWMLSLVLVAAASWLARRFELPRAIDPETELLVLNGSREGLFFAAFPGPARRSAVAILETPEQALRVIGVISAATGVFVIWVTRLLA